MSTTIAIEWVHPEKYEKDFDAVVTFLIQYINKRAPTLSLKVASVTQTRPTRQQKTSASHGIFKGEIELKKYSKEEYNSMSNLNCQQLYEFHKKVHLRPHKKKKL